MGWVIPNVSTGEENEERKKKPWLRNKVRTNKCPKDKEDDMV